METEGKIRDHLSALSYQYDAVGLITNVTREDGKRLAYAYNGLDRLISEKELAGGVSGLRERRPYGSTARAVGFL